jgi:hypothetical protein
MCAHGQYNYRPCSRRRRRLRVFAAFRSLTQCVGAAVDAGDARSTAMPAQAVDAGDAARGAVAALLLGRDGWQARTLRRPQPTAAAAATASSYDGSGGGRVTQQWR